MIKRTLFFSNVVCLTLKNKQLQIFNKETQEESSVPIEDIGFVVIENNQIYISIPAINALTENNAAVIFCNEKHLPFSMNLPLDCNTIQNQLFSAQISATIPTMKNCWKQIIEQKIKNQAKVLEKYNIPTYSYTPMEVKQVLTGYGRADKKEVEQMVRVTLGAQELPKLDDTVDAIAIAICHSRSIF